MNAHPKIFTPAFVLGTNIKRFSHLDRPVGYPKIFMRTYLFRAIRRKTRNMSEKKRRDQFNSLVNELSAMVTATSRKMDKSTVLRSAISFLKNYNGNCVMLHARFVCISDVVTRRRRLLCRGFGSVQNARHRRGLEASVSVQ